MKTLLETLVWNQQIKGKILKDTLKLISKNRLPRTNWAGSLFLEARSLDSLKAKDVPL